MKFKLEIDMTHESIVNNPNPSRVVAQRLKDIANRLESDSYAAVVDGKIKASNFVPSECGHFIITP
jgi:hypothetical protein